MRYKRIERRFKGGQGEVWSGIREEDDLPVAMKYLLEEPDSEDPEADRQRFSREVQCQTMLQHPNIMPILGRNTTSRPPWFVMPWADTSLRSHLSASPGGLDEDAALAIFRDIIAGVEYAHREGVLHRDLKPENVLLLNGRWCVSDFGLSRLLKSDSTTLTLPNARMGTHEYSAPEQFVDAHGVDARADIYALGKILFEMLTGRLPYPTVVISEAPARYRYVISRCILDDPADRLSTVDELSRQIETLVEAPADLAPPLERAQALVGQAAHESNALDEIDQILLEHDDDDVLYRKFVPYLPRLVIKRYCTHRHSRFLHVLRQFDEYVSGNLPFSYTDTVAAFLERVFRVDEDEEVRRLVLSRLLIMGSDHHRYQVREVFARLVGSRTDESHVFMLRELLEANPDAAAFMAEALQTGSMPAALRRALRSEHE